MIPDLSSEFLDEIPQSLNKSKNGSVTKAEFDEAFGHVELTLAEQLHDMRRQPKGDQGSKRRALQDAEALAILKYLNEACEAEKFTAESFVELAQKTSKTQSLSIDGLKTLVKEALPKKSAGMNFKILG